MSHVYSMSQSLWVHCYTEYNLKKCSNSPNHYDFNTKRLEVQTCVVVLPAHVTAIQQQSRHTSHTVASRRLNGWYVTVARLSANILVSGISGLICLWFLLEELILLTMRWEANQLRSLTKTNSIFVHVRYSSVKCKENGFYCLGAVGLLNCKWFIVSRAQYAQPSFSVPYRFW